MKYQNWETPKTDEKNINMLMSAGIPALAAKALSSRGIRSADDALSFLSSDVALLSAPLLMADMEKAAARIRRAVSENEHIAIYGDYDVDGITSVCIMVKYLRSQGSRCSYYIPSRLEEGYGLNIAALKRLKDDGVTLVITVDSGVTAISEALWARENGIDLIITDHHECKDVLPDAAAVINPRRPDCPYPFKILAGVGVAFKLVCCLSKGQSISELLSKYSYLAAIGTIADVMPLIGENRAITAHGLASIRDADNTGLKILIESISAENKIINSNFVSFNIAPRINAAGRMFRADVAVELLLTDDAGKSRELAELLCKLNEERRFFEQDIFNQAKMMLEKYPDIDGPGNEVIVLGGDGWHQGVIGIVASRMAEHYRRPVFLVCLDGDSGKASARSYGGLNLYSALEYCSDLLYTYGGHEQAVGFTINRKNIEALRTRLCDFARQDSHIKKDSVFISDGEVFMSELTYENIENMSVLEPHGTQNPNPVFFLRDVLITEKSSVGGGKHSRLKLEAGKLSVNAIFFSADPLSLGVAEGDCCDVLFSPQINNYRNLKLVQLILYDLRLCDKIRKLQDSQLEIYGRFKEGGVISHNEAAELIPSRAELLSMWRHLKQNSVDCALKDDLCCLCRKVTRMAGLPDTIMRMIICLDIFKEHGLIEYNTEGGRVNIKIYKTDGVTVDLSDSAILAELRRL